MFWNKKQKNNVEKINETLGNWVKYSDHTARVNPDMILNEFERRINLRYETRKDLELKKYENQNFKILCLKEKECEDCNYIRKGYRQYKRHDNHNYLKIEYPETLYIYNKEKKDEEMYISIPIHLIKNALLQDEEYNKQIDNLKKEIDSIEKEKGDFEQKYLK